MDQGARQIVNKAPPSTSRTHRWKIVRYKKIGSTNDKAHALAKQGAPDWTVVVTDVQTRGRGRAGRRWLSRKGGLWFAVLVRPKIPAAKLGLLQFLASNATRRAIERKTRLHVRVKWPNDLVVERGKLGGILVESSIIGEKVSYVIIGIGLNVNLKAEQIPSEATSVFLSSGTKHNLGDLLIVILKSMKSEYRLLEKPARILTEWWQNCLHRSKLVRVETPEGIVIGLNIGVDPEGFLLVRTERQGVERLTEGTLRVLGEQR